jgi:RND family efflux transporter MFP subunit
MANNSQRLIVRVLLGLVLAGAGVYFALDYFRPVALVAPVIAGPAVKAVSGSVTVRAESPIEIKSESQGKVIESYLDHGKLVKKDDVLVQLDPRDVDLQIEKNEIAFKLFKQQVESGEKRTKLDDEDNKEASQEIERQHQLGLMSEAAFSQNQRAQERAKLVRQDAKETQQSRNDEFENALKVWNLGKERMTIRAPFDWQIADFSVWPGQLVGNGTVVAKLISLRRTVEAKISEENSAEIKVGQKASVTFLPYGNWRFDAKVTKILPTSDPETQRRLVHLEVTIEPEKLRPGINGEVSITIAEHPSPTLVPQRALLPGKTALWVVKDGRVQLRKVEVGFDSLTAVEIVKGVAHGELVIVDQLDLFHDGDRVKVQMDDNPKWKDAPATAGSAN